MPARKLTAETPSFRARRVEHALAQIDRGGPAWAVRPRRDPLDPTGAQWFYARWCALECVHLWPCPALVLEYLEGGDPHLSSMRADEDARTTRATASGIASRYTLVGPNCLGFGSDGSAAMSALYAATGNIGGAAEWAIRALARAALDAVVSQTGDPLAQSERLAVLEAATARLQTAFAASAAEIFQGERAT